MVIRDLADQYEGYIIEQRRRFHHHPELSFQEKDTTAAIVEELKGMGIEVITFPDYTGCIGVLKGGQDGPTVMLRADIDALPVTEATGLSFASDNPGVMHACGHDNHIAMLLGAARILADLRDELKGTVKFIFQAAEESCHGALCHYITTSEAKHFQPMNVNFGILPPVETRDANGRRIRDKKQKKQLLAEKALAAIEAFKPQIFGC